MPSFQAIIFDMDGLLVDSESVWEKVETSMIEARGATYLQEIRDAQKQFVPLQLGGGYI